MQELGDLLRHAREAKGVTLADVEEATRIRARYLEALEYGDEHSLPARVYVEGFVRNYAAYLGLSQQEVMARYRAAHLGPGSEMPSLRPAIRPMRMPGPGPWLRAGVALVLISLLVAGGVYLGTLLPPMSLDLPGFGLPSISLPSNFLPNVLPNVLPDAALTATPNATPNPLDGGPTPTPELTPEATVTPAPTAVPTATAVPQIRVEVHLTERVWLRISLDGAVAFEGLLEAGESRTWVARDKVDMLSGNAGGMEVTVDGVPRGPLGAPGQVVELTWTRQ